MPFNYVQIAFNEVNRPVRFEYSDDNSLQAGYDEVWTLTEWNNWLASQPSNESLYTKEEIHILAERHQDLYFDNKGMLFLMDLKNKLMFGLGQNVVNNLTYQMIEAVNRWVNKLWSVAFYYDAQALEGINVNVNFVSAVGSPPCKFRDILWTVNPEFQAAEPDRVFETDINFYMNYE